MRHFPKINSLSPGLILAAFILAACQTDVETKPDNRPAPPDDCGASQYQSLIGTPVDPAAFAGHAALRIIPPGTAVTMDYRPDRLNVETDDSGIITRITCG